MPFGTLSTYCEWLAAVIHCIRLLQGVCFHLYSKTRSSGLAEYQLPELQRSPLDELSLQVVHVHTKIVAAGFGLAHAPLSCPLTRSGAFHAGHVYV